MNKYTIVALCGEAGSGKDTLAAQLAKEYDWNFVISCTTRPMREGEVDGVNYHFLSKDIFAEKILSGEMLEATIFNDWGYGTSIDSLKKDKINIGVFNPDGLSILSENSDINLYVFYLSVTPKERLLRQLNREENPNVEEIIRRYSADKKNFDFYLSGYNDYITLKNETKEDFEYNIKIIKDYLEN